MNAILMAAFVVATGGAGPPRSLPLTLGSFLHALRVGQDPPDEIVVSREVATGVFAQDAPDDNAWSREIAVGVFAPDQAPDNGWSREVAVGVFAPDTEPDNTWSREIAVSWDPDKAFFAESRELTVGGTAAFSGTVEFQGLMDQALAPSGVVLTVRDSTGTFKRDLPVVDGAVSATDLPRMRLWATVKASHWLRRSVVLDLGPGEKTGVEFSLLNGDIDEDNAVTVFDYALLSDAFDTYPGHPSWNAMADLDGDESITVFDYAILSDNFDKSGDEE